MATEKEKFMQQIAAALSEIIDEAYQQKMGFFLTVFEFDKPGVSDYISNANREQIIKSMRETAKRFEKGETIPTTVGQA